MPLTIDPILEQWMTRFRAPLIGLLASWGTDWHQAEELAQDTFAEAWLSRERLRGNPRDSKIVGPWLRGIAANLHRVRHRKIRQTRQEPLSEANGIAAPMLADERSERDERFDAMCAAFAKLRADQQTVLRMFYLDEASMREVAALLTLTEKAVEGRLYQARRALREQTERIHATTAGGLR